MTSWAYEAPQELTNDQYARWQNLLEERTGISFLQHKSILQKGLRQRMREIGADNYEKYFEKVRNFPEGVVEWMQLVDRISVKETSFFREKYSFKSVQKFLLDRLVLIGKEQNRTLDIWSVGCSTGEEAYSLAMLATEAVDYLKSEVFFAVFATDISQSALADARQGRYSLIKSANLPKVFRSKYFSKCGDKEAEIVSELKQRMCFSQGNVQLYEDSPQVLMDVIFCQNVFVYFRRERQHIVLDQLVEKLKPGGLLMVGPGEVIGWNNARVKRTSDNLVQSYIKC
ncbi:MAG: type IV pilus assembly protein PilK [Gammaproteobacteria bacterium]|jgi:type IV pilus assembly protein PilK